MGKGKGRQVGSPGDFLGPFRLVPLEAPSTGEVGARGGSPGKMLLNCLQGLIRSASPISRSLLPVLSAGLSPQGAPASHAFGSWGCGVRGAEADPGRLGESGCLTRPSPPGAGLTLTVARLRPWPAARQQRASPLPGFSAGRLPRGALPAPSAQAGAGSRADPGRVLRRHARVLIPHLSLLASVGRERSWCWTNCGLRCLAPPGLPWPAASWQRPWPCAGQVAGRRGARRPGRGRGSGRPWRAWIRRRSASASR